MSARNKDLDFLAKGEGRGGGEEKEMGEEVEDKRKKEEVEEKRRGEKRGWWGSLGWGWKTI